MSATLYLFPRTDEPGGFAWARLRGRRIERGEASADARLETRADERVVLIAPGEDVALYAVEPPTRSETQALAAARFTIEDDLAQPLEDVEVLLAERRGREAGRLREAFVVSRKRLEGWRAGLEAIGVTPDHVIPDYAALAVPPSAVVVLDRGDRVLVRGRGLGLAVDAALAPRLLPAALARRPDDAVVLRSDRADGVLPLEARGSRTVEIGAPVDEAALLALYEKGLEDGPAIDLARAWRRRPAGGPLRLGPWRTAAGLAAGVAVAFLALMGGETLALRAHAAAAERESERILLAAFPDVSRVVNPRAQLRERLSAMGADGSASFLELSAILSEAIADVEAMEIESLRYDAGGGLQAALVYGTYADVERLRAGIEARGGRLAEGASRMRGERMTGDVVVTRR